MVFEVSIQEAWIIFHPMVERSDSLPGFDLGIPGVGHVLEDNIGIRGLATDVGEGLATPRPLSAIEVMTPIEI